MSEYRNRRELIHLAGGGGFDLPLTIFVIEEVIRVPYNQGV